jgi:hypothetical protein
MSHNKHAHPVFTPKGCLEVVNFLHHEFSEVSPEIYKKERSSWYLAHNQAEILVKNPSIFGSTSAFGCLIGMSNNILLNEEVSYPLHLACYLAALPVLDNFLYKGGFRDSIEDILLMEWPGVVPVVYQDPETRIVTVWTRYKDNIRGRIKKIIYRYPSPREIVTRVNEFFGVQMFVKYESAIVGDRVNFRVLLDDEIIEDASNGDSDADVRSFLEEIISLAWKASGNM